MKRRRGTGLAAGAMALALAGAGALGLVASPLLARGGGIVSPLFAEDQLLLVHGAVRAKPRTLGHVLEADLHVDEVFLGDPKLSGSAVRLVRVVDRTAGGGRLLERLAESLHARGDSLWFLR